MENYPSAEHWWRRLVPKIFEEAFGLKGLEAGPRLPWQGGAQGGGSQNTRRGEALEEVIFND